jgi:precorrin-6Y C5,15-methyltransferase (decarboxylating)
MSGRWLTILGIGEDGEDGLSPAGRDLVQAAVLVVGGRRHLALMDRLIGGKRLPWPSPIAAAIAPILARRPAPVAVLASGDPYCYGVGVLLARHVPLAETRCLPAPSAFTLASSRLGWAMQDCATISFCGRPIEALAPLQHSGARVLALSADAKTPAAVAALLVAHGFGGSVLHVLKALGGPNEHLRLATAVGFNMDDLHPLNLLAIEVAAGPGALIIPLAAGLDDAAFEHDGQLTKREVRAVTLAALAPRRGELLWDIGGGAGSIGIEWMLRHPANRAIGIEREPARAARIARNAARLGVPGLQLVEDEAPGALAGLPGPDAVFVGGGVHVPGLLDAAWQALPPDGRLVAKAVTVEAEASLLGGARAVRRHADPNVGRATGDDRTHAGLSPSDTRNAVRCGETMIVAGIGCRRDCPAEDIVAIVRLAQESAACRVDALAAPAFKQGEPGLHDAARTLGVGLSFLAATALAGVQHLCPTRSHTAARHVGVASIAEASAIAASGGKLLLPRIANGRATCALAAT